MKKITRAASAVLSIMLLASSFAGCSKNGSKAGEPKTVEDNGQPFFTSETIEFESPETDENVTWTNYTQPFIYDGKFYSVYNCDTGDLSSKDNPGEIHVFDMSGKLLEKKSLKEVTQKAVKGADSCNIDSENVIGTKFLLTAYKQVKDEYQQAYYLYDFLTDDISPLNLGKLGKYAYVSGIKELDDGRLVVLVVEYDENSGAESYTLMFGDGDKFDKKDNISKKLEKLKLSYIGEMQVVDGNLSFSGYGDDYDYGASVYYDVKTGDLTLADTEDEESNTTDSSYSYYMSLDGLKYVMNETGFYKVGDNGAKEELVLFENANVCVNKLMYSKLMSISDDEIVFGGVSYTAGNSTLYSIKLIKHDKNPNVGKELLIAASMSYINEQIEESIVKFNNENDKVFIKIDRSYEEKWTEYDDIDWRDEESYSKANELHSQNQADLVSQLAIDLIAGDGPDILFNCAGYSQLLKEDCLLDMSDIVNEVLDPNDVFTNILDGAKDSEGKLLTLPLLFSSQGIVAKKDLVSKDQVGFTYDEYAKFVKDKCNGNDTFNYEGFKKTDYLEMLVDTEMGTFIHDGKADFDNDNFYALIEYVKGVPEIKASEDEDEPQIFDARYEEEQESAYSGWLASFSDYCYYFNCSDGKSDYVYLGYPSAKAHGPLANIDLDVAISASCGSVDSAKEFLKIITGQDYMKVLSESNWSACISKSATKANAEKSLKQLMNDRKIEHQYNPAVPLKKITDKDVENFIDLLGSLDVKPAIDLSIVMIIKEEAQAYFAGQKDAKEVAATISDRAQTVLNEKN